MRAHRYTPDFKADALAMIRRGDRSFRQLAEALGVSHWTLRDWYKADEMARKKGKRPKESSLVVTPAAETPEQKLERLERENSRLRKQVDRLEEDRAILKKAAAFFAKESG
jgi:transposase-like protein